MEAMDYDPDIPGYTGISERFDKADAVMGALDHLSPLKMNVK